MIPLWHIYLVQYLPSGNVAVENHYVHPILIGTTVNHL